MLTGDSDPASSGSAVPSSWPEGFPEAVGGQGLAPVLLTLGPELCPLCPQRFSGLIRYEMLSVSFPGFLLSVWSVCSSSPGVTFWLALLFCPCGVRDALRGASLPASPACVLVSSFASSAAPWDLGTCGGSRHPPGLFLEALPMGTWNQSASWPRAWHSPVTLAGYSFVFRYCPGGKHVPCVEKKRDPHQGTLEFISLDLHRGTDPSRRSDLQALGYCLLKWLYGALPWTGQLPDAQAVMGQKERFLYNVAELVRRSCGQRKPSEALKAFLKAVMALQYEEKPDYRMLQTVLAPALEQYHLMPYSPISF
uniref:VRK serine/threonine kinase 2 n=1 Tax=Sarcophilus harrisii TaxID=9305 RepID=A0A7N4NH49_SARHA